MTKTLFPRKLVKAAMVIIVVDLLYTIVNS